MKSVSKLVVGLLAFVLVTILPLKSSFAIPVSGVGVRLALSTASVGTVNWTPVISSTTKSMKSIAVFNSSPSPLEVGLAAASDNAGNEVRQLVVPGAVVFGSSNSVPSAVVYPLTALQGVRVSLRALGSSATSGDALVNVIYY